MAIKIEKEDITAFLILVLGCLLLAGCTMDPAAIKKAEKDCLDNGMEPNYNILLPWIGTGKRVIAVYCLPKKSN